jgi:DNA/RNA endonuclease G (NUC1)
MPRSVPDRRRSAIVLSAFLVASCATAERAVAPAPGGGDGRAAVAAAAPPSVRFSEIHYDNASTDVGEAIELSGPAGTSLAGWSVVLYNGNGGAAYNTRALTATIPATCGDRGVVVLTYPQDGIQNGSPDGMALVDGNGQVVEFLSYEGTFTAVGGPANGMVSTDIGVSQAGNTPAGRSLGRTAAGTWNAEGPATFGACNDAEGGGPPVGPLDRLTVTPATATVTVGATVNATALAEDAEGDDVTAGTIAWTDEGSDIVTVTPSADGRSAAVRGDAPGGPARVIATLTLDGVTRADTVLVTVNAATPPGGTTRIVFSGFNDAPLPPGFEDQLFATAFSGPSNADALPAMTFTWRALTPEVATIDARGVVRGVADGRALFEARSADGFAATAFVDVRTPVDPTTAVYANHLEFGAPVDATPGDEFRVTYPEFVSSYNRDRGQPNWVAYNLEATHRGPAERCDCFTPDPSLPGDFPRLSTDDYTGSGYTRGHLVMSEDRTTGPNPPQTSLDNARTFLFSNIVPQLAANNSGPWLALETQLGALATSGTRELFIYAGGRDYQGTLKNEGRVSIPGRTWKIAVILPRDAGLASVRTAADLEVIAIDVPNLAADAAGLQSRPWQDFRISVDELERLTGYDFLAALPDDVEAVVEAQATGTRALSMELQPDRVSVSGTPTVNVVLFGGATFDATTVDAATVRLVVAGGTGVAPIARGGVVNTSVRDMNGDGRADRVIGFATSALAAAGFGPGASTLVLRPAGSAPAWEAVDATPPTVVP